MESYEILVGVGNLYIADTGTTFPDVDAAPGGDWTNLGETDGGVTITMEQTVDEHRVDQETGPVKATRSDETVAIETSLAIQTVENLAKVLGNTVTDTPPGADVGTREVTLYRGDAVTEYAMLFRGDSPYDADYPGQYELRRGYFNGSTGMSFVKDGKTLIPVEFRALINLDAANDAEKFGRLVVQDAAAV